MERDGDFEAEMAAQPADCAPVMRRRGDPFIILFTSGTTRKPKGVVYPLFALLQFAMFIHEGLHLRQSDIYWCLADPGWALGVIGTLTGPLMGCTTVMYEGVFTVESTVRVANDLGVTNIVAAPTVFRMMRATGIAAVTPMRGRLRAFSSGGEPLNPELNRWAADLRTSRPPSASSRTCYTNTRMTAAAWLIQRLCSRYRCQRCDAHY